MADRENCMLGLDTNRWSCTPTAQPLSRRFPINKMSNRKVASIVKRFAMTV
jgi:hypothetical protein